MTSSKTTPTAPSSITQLDHNSMTQAQTNMLNPGLTDDAEIPVAGINAIFSGLVQQRAPASLAANDDAAPTDQDSDVSFDPDEGNEVVIEKPDAPRGGHANARLRGIVGGRLVRAREIAGLTQTEAATGLGYSTPAQLNMWEFGRRLAPMVELIRAAEFYSVSVDFLLGLSLDETRDPAQGLRDAILRGVRSQLTRVAEITTAQVERHARLLGPHIGTVGGLVASGDALLDAIQTFCRLNQEALEEQRGSATLVRCAEDFESELLSARKKIRLHDALDDDLRRALSALGDEDRSPRVARDAN